MVSARYSYMLFPNLLFRLFTQISIFALLIYCLLIIFTGTLGATKHFLCSEMKLFSYFN